MHFWKNILSVWIILEWNIHQFDYLNYRTSNLTEESEQFKIHKKITSKSRRLLSQDKVRKLCSIIQNSLVMRLNVYEALIRGAIYWYVRKSSIIFIRNVWLYENRHIAVTSQTMRKQKSWLPLHKQHWTSWNETAH